MKGKEVKKYDEHSEGDDGWKTVSDDGNSDDGNSDDGNSDDDIFKFKDEELTNPFIYGLNPRYMATNMYMGIIASRNKQEEIEKKNEEIKKLIQDKIEMNTEIVELKRRLLEQQKENVELYDKILKLEKNQSE